MSRILHINISPSQKTTGITSHCVLLQTYKTRSCMPPRHIQRELEANEQPNISISMISVQSKCPNRKCSKLPHPPILAPTVLSNQLCTQDTKAKSSNFFLAFTVDRWISHTNTVSHFSKTSLSIRHQCKSCSKLATPFYQNIQLLMVSKNSLQKDHDKVENGKHNLIRLFSCCRVRSQQ